MGITALLQQLAKQLMARQAMLTTAESCTGGGLAHACTALPGSSQWFERGFVTYSNLAKQQMLAVPESLITEHGAVSEQVASAMAMGAIANSAAHYSCAVTGIAGPDGGSAEKPVGLVWFAWSSAERQNCYSQSQLFEGDRESIRNQSIVFAFNGLLEKYFY